MRSVLTPLSMSLLALLAACSSDSPTQTGPCTFGELADCGRACSDDVPCSGGLFCEDGLCSAECTVATSERDCGAAGLCTVDGRCKEPTGTGDAGGDGGDGGTGTGDSGDVCAAVEVGTSKRVPNVVLIVDQSGSMEEALGDTTRWEALRSTLLDDDGILAEFDGQVRFGFAMYSARESDPEPRMCPLVRQVDVSLDSVAEIRDVYGDAEPLADTPTGDSIDVVLASVQEAGLLGLDVTDPTIFILATDGEPDRCEELNPQNGQEEAIAAVERAYEAGVRTYVIAVADEDDLSEAHVQDLANAGVGMEGAESYRVNDDTGLRAALRELIGREVTCELTLNRAIDAQDACNGTVTLGGNALECGGADGFEVLPDGRTLRVNGDACERLKAGGTLVATFPCDDVLG